MKCIVLAVTALHSHAYIIYRVKANCSFLNYYVKRMLVAVQKVWRAEMLHCEIAIRHNVHSARYFVSDWFFLHIRLERENESFASAILCSFAPQTI